MDETRSEAPLTSEELRSEPGVWMTICNRRGWKKHHVPKEVATKRRKARSCIYAGRQRKRRGTKAGKLQDKLDQLQLVVNRLTDENTRLTDETVLLRKNLLYAVAEINAARNDLIHGKT